MCSDTFECLEILNIISKISASSSSPPNQSLHFETNPSSLAFKTAKRCGKYESDKTKNVLLGQCERSLKSEIED